MTRPTRRIAPLALAAALAAGMLTVPSVAGAASTKTCKISASKARSLGATYVTYAPGKPGFKVLGTSCASGQAVVKSFHSCRLKKGTQGRCSTRVRGYSCSDSRPSSGRRVVGGSLLSFEGKVTCKSASKRVIHNYQQDT